MKTIRKQCIRCKEPFKPSQVDYEKELYHCTFCDSVSSIVEERDVIAHGFSKKNIQGIKHFEEGSNLIIQCDQLPTGEMLRSALGILLMTAILSVFCLMIHLKIAIIIGVIGLICLILAVGRYYQIDHRKYEIELTPYKVYFYEKILGKRVLKEIASYEIDRIKILTRPNIGVPGTSKTDFIIITKQYKEIKPFYHSKDKLQRLIYLKSLMDNYLNIEGRQSDIQFEVNL